MAQHIEGTCPTPKIFCATCRTVYTQSEPHNCVKETVKQLLALKECLREQEEIPHEVTNFMPSDTCPFDTYLPVPATAPLYDYVKEAEKALASC